MGLWFRDLLQTRSDVEESGLVSLGRNSRRLLVRWHHEGGQLGLLTGK